jgi:hypothetical protein
MPTETQSPPLSIDEAIARYPNEWIFMRVTTKDEHHAPSHGVVLAHDPSRRVLQQAILALLAPAWSKENEYYTFFAHQRIRTREEWSQAIEDQIRSRS